MDRTRPWLAVAGAALILAVLLPPAGGYARRYAFVQAVQFVIFAAAGPALLVLGWRGLPGRRGLPAWHRPRGTAGRPRAAARPADHAAALRLLAFLAAVICWRLPVVLDTLSRDPVLTVAEMASLAAAGCGIWSELAGAAGSRPPLPRPLRAAMAAVAMWAIWVIAYITGMSGAVSVTPARGHAVAGAVSAAADRQLAVGVMWAVPAVCFVPVVYAMLLTWLSAREDPDQELTRLAGLSPPAGPGPGQAPRPPRGWRSPPPGGRPSRPQDP
jgi:cytochrome c oxidase assembly factor CtaG